MADADVIERLDLMLAVLQLAHHDAITAASRTIRADPVSAAILEAAEDWIGAAALQQKVASGTQVGSRTISRRISELVTRRALTSRGGGRSTEYRSLGLV